jgi:hypothetical protein
MKPRLRRLLAALALAALVIAAALAVFVWLGPVPVSDKRVMLDFLLGRGIAPPDETRVAAQLRAPPGLRVQVYSDEVPLARVMVFTESGDLLVSRTRAGVLSILARDADGDGASDGHGVLLESAAPSPAPWSRC